LHLVRFRSFVQPVCSRIQQPHTVNEEHYPADRDVLEVTWLQEMLTQVPKS
jgi:hypothetical protein